MSHFIVVVIGEDVEGQLAPFHEFECTGEDDRYVKDVDATKDVLGNMEKAEKDWKNYSCYDSALEYALEWHAGVEKHQIVENESDVDLCGPHKYGYAIVKDGELIKAVRRTNPDAKWDWYVMGGRWCGYFPLKPGFVGVSGKSGTFGNKAKEGHADQVTKGMVDWEGARQTARVEATTEFDQWEDIFTKYGRPTSFQDLEDEHGKHGRDVVRGMYRAQPAIQAAGDLKFLGWRCPIDNLGFDRETYITKRVNAALVPFAILKDGKWYEKGDMGWFGCVDNEKDPGDWQAEVAKLFDSLDDQTLMTAIDCHI